MCCRSYTFQRLEGAGKQWLRDGCFASFISTNSCDFQIISTNDQLGALSWGTDGKTGGLVLFYSSVMLLQIFCIYAAIHTCMDLDCWIIGGVWLHPEALTVCMFLKWCLQVCRGKHECKWRGLCEVGLEWQSPVASQSPPAVQGSDLLPRSPFWFQFRP